MLIQKVGLEPPPISIINAVLDYVAITPAENYQCSPIGQLFDPWWDNLNLLEKGVVSRKFLNSGLIIDQTINQLTHTYYDALQENLYETFYPQRPQEHSRINHWFQLCEKFSDDKFIGIVPVPNQWRNFNRGINLIYTFPGYEWTMRFFKFKDNVKDRCELTAKSYNELDLIEEEKIEENTWYRIDFTHDLLTEEHWVNKCLRFGLLLR